MNHPFTPLSEEEIDELGRFLLHEVESDEAMQAKVERNDRLFMRKRKKFEKCCGLAANLH